MKTPVCSVLAIGAGRMGRGIALAYAIGGRDVAIVDFKPREPERYTMLRAQIRAELRLTLLQLADLGMFTAEEAEHHLGRIHIAPLQEAASLLANAQLVYECVPETRQAKQDALGRIGRAVGAHAIIASTTSTMLASELCGFVARPAQFLNAHWLNPAYLIPLVEVSPHEDTAAAVVERLKMDLEAVGKVPVLCRSSPGYIVPRLQALVMNEAARMVEEGLASPEEIDRATRYGLGFRFAAIGVLEFIDYGGNDILYHANRYLAQHLSPQRYAMPDIVARYMQEDRNGLRTARGFLSYEGKDLDAYRQDVLARTLGMLQHFEGQTKDSRETGNAGKEETKRR